MIYRTRTMYGARTRLPSSIERFPQSTRCAKCVTSVSKIDWNRQREVRKKVSIPHSLSLVLFLSHFVSVSDYVWVCVCVCLSLPCTHKYTHTHTHSLSLSRSLFRFLSLGISLSRNDDKAQFILSALFAELSVNALFDLSALCSIFCHLLTD